MWSTELVCGAVDAGSSQCSGHPLSCPKALQCSKVRHRSQDANSWLWFQWFQRCWWEVHQCDWWQVQQGQSHIAWSGLLGLSCGAAGPPAPLQGPRALYFNSCDPCMSTRVFCWVKIKPLLCHGCTSVSSSSWLLAAFGYSWEEGRGGNVIWLDKWTVTLLDWTCQDIHA